MTMGKKPVEVDAPERDARVGARHAPSLSCRNLGWRPAPAETARQRSPRPTDQRQELRE